MSQWMTWFTMGKYSVYVWSAYGIAAILLAMQLLGIRWQTQRTWRKLQLWFKR